MLTLFAGEALKTAFYSFGIGGIVIFVAFCWRHLRDLIEYMWRSPMIIWQIREWAFIADLGITLFLSTYFSLRLLGLSFKVSNHVSDHVSDHDFFLRDGLKWRYNIYSGVVESTPYCPQHQIQLNPVFVSWDYYCYSCDESADHRWPLHSEERQKTYDAVCRIVKAKVRGHLKV